MEKVTYYIGAGASYHCLPLIKTMNERMVAFSRFLKTQQSLGKLKHEFTSTFIEELDNFIEIARQRTSIDAHARELAISNSPESKTKLRVLKAILSSYIIFEQLLKPRDLIFYSEEIDISSVPTTHIPYKYDFQEMLKTHIDKRYISFWGEYLDSNIDIPIDNLKIISWNYDMQFESSYSSIKNYSLELVQQNLQIFPSTVKSINISRFCILKLNGTAGLIGQSGSQKLINAFDLKEHHLLDNLDYLIDLLKNNYHQSLNKPIFSFAWEDEPIVSETRKKAQEIIENTTILVIIGYSFPTLNSKIDKVIFKNIDKLKQVYFQTPKEELPEILGKLDGINSRLRDLVVGKHNLDTFYIPAET